ncbi:hypothetical protein B0H13DRAFT_2326934 [Mycena leptocephala]|nr:hypothetical protein B0H13DRAFT_2326934 [Mycena leptocephala]
MAAAVNDYGNGPETEPTILRKSKLVQPTDKSLYDWREKRDAYSSEFIRWDGPGDADVELCPGCARTTLQRPEYRCRDCHGGLLYCHRCIVEKHRENLFHRIYFWDGEFFKKIPLASLGLRVQLGHSPLTCCTVPEPSKARFVMLHTNGIHEVLVDFCGCERTKAAGPHEIQLLRAGWFPATHERPHTAATFAVLDQFHQETLQAKVTMYDFYGVLEKLTNNVGVKPPDRYAEFIRLCKEYWHSMMLKHSGRSPAYDSSGAEGTKSGELAIECPACPRPGINLPEGWEDVAPEQRHLYTFFLALDACFRLKRRLVSGHQKEMNTCSGLAALDYANTKFSRGYASTGVGMGVCARHEFVQPNGVGDLQHGEHFANMHYIWGSILRHKDPRVCKLTSYNITCIWSKGLQDRVLSLPELVRIHMVLLLFVFVIPKMHIHGHTLLCQLLFSLNLILGCAQTDGEGIERLWAGIGGVATSTRDMGPGSRHRVLDCQWSYWNWQKLVGLVTTLHRRMDRARAELVEQQQAARVPGWKQMVEDFENNSTKPNPYEIKIVGLTEAQVCLKFTQEEAEEAKRRMPALHDISPSKFIAVGLELEEEQRRIRMQAILKKAQTTEMQIDLGTMHSKLSRRVAQFRKLQMTYTPVALQVLGEMDIPEDQTVENMPLMLPSRMSPAVRAMGIVTGLADIEALMRHAQCRAALASLRNQLHIKSGLLIYKKNHARHQGANTRSWTIVARNESKIGLHSEKYQNAWESIRLLGVDQDPDPVKVGWEILQKEHIRCMEDTEDIKKKAERRKRQEEKRERGTARAWYSARRDG